MKLIKNIVILLILMCSGAVGPVYSQQSDGEKANDSAKRELSVGVGFYKDAKPLLAQIGAGIGPFPEYEGSEDYGISALPLVDIQKPGAFFIEGASINFNNGLASAGLTILHFSYTENNTRSLLLEIGPLFRAYAGRDQSDNEVLIGLGDIDQSAGIGGFLRLNAGQWLASLSAASQEAGNDQEGMLLGLELEYRALMNNSLKISTLISTSWADDEYMQGYFSVSNAQSISTGLTEFSSNAGIKDIGLLIKTSYALSPDWSLAAQIGYWRLLNDAADSPIVEDKGSVNQARALIGLKYQF